MKVELSDKEITLLWLAIRLVKNTPSGEAFSFEYEELCDRLSLICDNFEEV